MEAYNIKNQFGKLNSEDLRWYTDHKKSPGFLRGFSFKIKQLDYTPGVPKMPRGSVQPKV